MKRADLVRKLEAAGCVFVRHGVSHDRYRNPNNEAAQPLPCHRENNETSARLILKNLDVNLSDWAHIAKCHDLIPRGLAVPLAQTIGRDDSIHYFLLDGTGGSQFCDWCSHNRCQKNWLTLQSDWYRIALHNEESLLQSKRPDRFRTFLGIHHERPHYFRFRNVDSLACTLQNPQ